jgi:putative membrane protein
VTWWAIIAASLAGAFIMVSWDVAMDPYQSTVTGDWIWHEGGGYFGVPLHNYAGWFGTVFVFMLVYFIFASRYGEQPQEHLIQNLTVFWSLPVLYYALLALGIIYAPWSAVFRFRTRRRRIMPAHLRPWRSACRWWLSS